MKVTDTTSELALLLLKHQELEISNQWLPILAEYIDKVQTEAIQDYIRPYVDCCIENNGIPVCKNCGLSELNQSKSEELQGEGK